MKKNKLIFAMYLSVIALSVASVSMSIAWYASSRNLYVNSIDITIDTDRMLEISTSKDGDFVDFINYSELDPTGVFLPLTSAHSDDWMSVGKDMPVFYDESRCYEQENLPLYVEATGGYFSQKFYLKSDDDVYVTIDPSQTYIKAPDPNQFEQNNNLKRAIEYFEKEEARYKGYTVDQIKEMLDKVVNAMRFSILVKDEKDNYQYYIIDPNKEGVTYLGGLLDNDYDQYYDYFLKEGSSDLYERVYGEIIGDKSEFYADIATESDSDLENINEKPSAFNAHHKAGVIKFNQEDAKEKGIFKKEESFSLDDFKNGAPFHFPVYINEPKEVVVSIYIEGWDKDSINSTMGAAFFSNLTFKIEREM